MKQQQILVPLDGSRLAEAALPHALLLARTTGSALTLLRVVLPSAQTPPLASAVHLQDWEADWLLARTYLERLAGHLVDEQFAVEYAIAAGDPAATIVEYAIEHPEIAMIVMATHGRNGLQRWVFGSVADLVLHVTPVPLLLVRPDADAHALQSELHRSYHRILVPLDQTELSEKALGPAGDMAAKLGASLVLVSVVPSRDEHAQVEPGVPIAPLPSERAPDAARLAEYLTARAQPLRDGGLVVETRVVYGYSAEVILQTGAQAGCDLIVLATHARAALQPIWMGSVALKVMQGAQQPVLLVRDLPAPPAAVQPAPEESLVPSVSSMLTGYVQDS